MTALVDASKVAVVVPNWNGADRLKDCLDSLRAQSLRAHVIVVDNGSVDGSVALIEKDYPEVELIKHERNLGFAGGVNAGLRSAIKQGFKYAAAFNNDAVADKDWLKHLAAYLDKRDRAGVATCKLLTADGQKLDSTGDYYTVWGLPYPRGRGQTNIDQYDHSTDVFGVSGGASLYRVSMLEDIGLFDEAFFAYYEDVDLSFRAQLAGWKAAYVPASKVYHQIGATSSQIKGFVTYQTLKNLPILLVKNVPRRYLWKVSWRYFLVQGLFVCRALSRGQIWPIIKGKFVCVRLLPSTLAKRRQIQGAKQVSDDYIWGLIVHDLPPNAQTLRRLRSRWWKITRRQP